MQEVTGSFSQATNGVIRASRHLGHSAVTYDHSIFETVLPYHPRAVVVNTENYVRPRAQVEMSERVHETRISPAFDRPTDSAIAHIVRVGRVRSHCHIHNEGWTNSDSTFVENGHVDVAIAEVLFVT